MNLPNPYLRGITVPLDKNILYRMTRRIEGNYTKRITRETLENEFGEYQNSILRFGPFSLHNNFFIHWTVFLLYSQGTCPSLVNIEQIDR